MSTIKGTFESENNVIVSVNSIPEDQTPSNQEQASVTPINSINIASSLIPKPPFRDSVSDPEKCFAYLDETGKLSFYICRYDYMKEGVPDKTFSALRWDGENGWVKKAPNDPLVPFNLDKIVSTPDATIIFCEGEKCANACSVLFPNYVATTTAFGSNSAQKTDFSVFGKRNIIIWPDNDDPGHKYAQNVANLAISHGATSVRIINLTCFKHMPGVGANGKAIITDVQRELPKKWDAADALSEGYTAEYLELLAQQPGFLMEVADFAAVNPKILPANDNINFYNNTPNNETPYFTCNRENGVVYHWYDNENLAEIKVCSYLAVTARVRNKDSKSWGRLLEIYDSGGVKHEWVMPMELLSGDCNDFRKELLYLGVDIQTGSRINSLLTQYVKEAATKELAICTDRLGWHGKAFVTPSRTIEAAISTATTEGSAGEAANTVPAMERILFQGGSAIRNSFTQKGDLKSWQDNISAYCLGNSRLIFAVSLAFAAPLLRLLKGMSMGFNFIGGSSEGKTTALKVAASVCGGVDYVQQWRATSNGLEGIARYHNDTLLVLDELSQVDPNEIFQIIYMLANGKSKIRANQTGLTRSVSGWQLVWLSAGEVGLETIMSEGKRSMKVGQQIRQVDLQANAGRKLNTETLGIFEDIHGFSNGAEFSNFLVKNASEHYGVPIIKWIEALVDGSDLFLEKMRSMHSNFLNKLLENHQNIEGQTRRVASTFALIAVAGECATEAGITGWQMNDTYNALSSMFNGWVFNKGGAGNQERKEVLRQVKSFLEQYGESSFEQINNKGSYVNDRRVIHDRVGFVDKDSSGTKFLAFPEQYVKRMIKGFNQRTATKVLREEKWLLPDKNGKSTQVISIPHIKKQARMYVFDADAIFSSEI